MGMVVEYVFSKAYQLGEYFWKNQVHIHVLPWVNRQYYLSIRKKCPVAFQLKSILVLSLCMNSVEQLIIQNFLLWWLLIAATSHLIEFKKTEQGYVNIANRIVYFLKFWKAWHSAWQGKTKTAFAFWVFKIFYFINFLWMFTRYQSKWLKRKILSLLIYMIQLVKLIHCLICPVAFV